MLLSVPVYWKLKLSPLRTKMSRMASKIGPEGDPAKIEFGLLFRLKSAPYENPP
jgi:hypothetical protein